ncbi:L,D-transpeptidase family protein [Pararhizobium mangrovi]|uniref:Twin-arginine translocation signal domain-containing protein n=1 Tax=Pararhizobium mangrovi TaxID=2590452 RepID=A0A506UBT2_9HYPH|nr:L,D-transpeptidase family protein [Pararhizobium mangrovi]TPW31862.1 twin-arginine translocation signal domain-containing protein [Pararhizobium mangrovi]
MSRKFGSESFSRRGFLRAVTAAGALTAAGGASAQSIVDSVIRGSQRGWNDSFDSSPGHGGDVNSLTPILNPRTLSYVQLAINRYQQLVANGGWPMVPEHGKLSLGSVDDAVLTLRKRLMISGDLSQSAGMSRAFDSYVDAAVRRFQARHGLPVDGVLGEYSYKAMNVSADVRLGQLQTNLVRLNARSGDLGPRYVVVNIPAASIEAVENGQVVQRHTAIVGQTSRETPTLDSAINQVILNPYWTAPRSIIRKDIMPVMRKDPQYLTRNHIRLFDAQGNEVDPSTVDWSADKAPNLTFRQDPGKINAMASVKINFPNKYSVYMHDTPEQSLFGQIMRFDSSGCVRVQNVRDLVVWLLRDNQGWSRSHIEQVISTRKNTEIPLEQRVPVHFVYITAWSTSDGVVQFRDDIYHHDGVDELALR